MTLAWKAQWRSLHWACTQCLQRGHAIKANPLQQTFCDYPPYLAFYDETLHCEACDQDFIFSADEQRFWYEDLKFFVQSQPKQCSECRRKRREHNRLNQELEKAIRSLDRRDVQQVAMLLDSTCCSVGNKKKAMEFLGRARNLARKQGNSDLASQLDTLQTQVKDAPHSSIWNGRLAACGPNRRLQADAEDFGFLGDGRWRSKVLTWPTSSKGLCRWWRWSDGLQLQRSYQ